MTAPAPAPPNPPARRSRLRWPRWALVAAVLVAAVAVAVWPRGAPAPAPAAVDVSADRARADLPPCRPATAPPAGSALAGARVTCLGDGRATDLAAAIGAGPAIVNVWASWCVPCQGELPVLAEYAAQPGALRVVGVDVQDDQKSALDLLASLRVRLPMVFDGGNAAFRALRVPNSLPASYLVRADGSATLIADPRLFTAVAEVRAAVAGGSGHG